MTKSTITRERLEQLADNNTICKVSWDERIELAQIALAAMDSESGGLPLDYLQWHKDGLEWAAQLAEANHPETGDWLYDDPIELAKAIRKGPDMPPAQPAPEYPETLPCPVLLEPGLRFGKGIKTSTMLAALARRAVYESDMAALSPEERAEFQARIEDFKALIAQPVPVVPQDVLEALQKVARIRLDLNDFDGDRRGIADCLGDAEEALIEVVNRRAATLQASPVCTCPSGDGSLRWPCPVHPGNSPAIPDSARDALEKALAAMEFMGDTLNNLDAVCTEDVELVAPAFDAVRNVLAAAPQSPGSEPATVPGTWIPVNERLPEAGGDMIVFTGGIVMSGVSYAKKKGFYIQALEYDDDEPVDSVTHWMPLPAAPQEVKGE